MSLDPSNFVDTSNWAGELGVSAQPPPRRQGRGSASPPNRVRTPPTGHSEMESLEAMLEPDRTGLHGKAGRKLPWLLIAIVMLVLAAGAAAAVVLLMT